MLDIPHFTVDAQASFKAAVIDDFCDTYLLGQTPNPCVRCNALIKFDRLLSFAKERGADFLVTGHYARIAKQEKGYSLQTGCDSKKDQSYFLYRLTQEQLAATAFPLGAMNKEAVYQKALSLGLPYEEILESQEICFVNQKGYQEFLTENRPESVVPGAIVTESGKVVGSHQGIAFHTVGQRRGLNVALGERVYVTRLDVVKNEVIVGEEDCLLEKALSANRVVWGGAGVPDCPMRVEAKIRYRATPKAATLTETDTHSFKISFDEPERGISPGQSVVLYQGDTVVGGGVIFA
jgi:tRNA-specific 2-thiouridylase